MKVCLEMTEVYSSFALFCSETGPADFDSIILAFINWHSHTRTATHTHYALNELDTCNSTFRLFIIGAQMLLYSQTDILFILRLPITRHNTMLGIIVVPHIQK